MFIINVFVECHSKNQIFSYTEKKFDKEIVLAEGTQISLLHIFLFILFFCGRRLQKIVVVICLSKICFSFACFKICFLTTLIDDQLQSFLLYCHIWYQFQHHILWLVFRYFFSWYCCTEKKAFTRKCEVFFSRKKGGWGGWIFVREK